MSRGLPYSDAENQEIRQGFSAGLDDKTIARSIGRTARAVGVQRRVLGLRRDQGSGANAMYKNAEFCADVTADFEAGLSVRESADRRGVHYNTVKKCRHHLGLVEIVDTTLADKINAAWAAKGETAVMRLCPQSGALESRLSGGVPTDRWRKVKG